MIQMKLHWDICPIFLIFFSPSYIHIKPTKPATAHPKKPPPQNPQNNQNQTSCSREVLKSSFCQLFHVHEA